MTIAIQCNPNSVLIDAFLLRCRFRGIPLLIISSNTVILQSTTRVSLYSEVSATHALLLYRQRQHSRILLLVRQRSGDPIHDYPSIIRASVEARLMVRRNRLAWLVRWLVGIDNHWSVSPITQTKGLPCRLRLISTIHQTTVFRRVDLIKLMSLNLHAQQENCHNEVALYKCKGYRKKKHTGDEIFLERILFSNKTTESIFSHLSLITELNHGNFIPTRKKNVCNKDKKPPHATIEKKNSSPPGSFWPNPILAFSRSQNAGAAKRAKAAKK